MTSSSFLSPVHAALLLLLLFSPPGILALEPSEGEVETSAIIGGTLVNETKPWMAALIRRAPASMALADRQFCGGVLIAPTWVMTAAHCVNGATPDAYQVVLGKRDLHDADIVPLDAIEQVTHPFYEAAYKGSDIALIRLKVPSSNAPIALANPAMEAAAMGTALTAMGWGNTSYKDEEYCELRFFDAVENRDDFSCKVDIFRPGTRALALMQTELTLHSFDECEQRFQEVLYQLGRSGDATAHFSDAASRDVLCAWKQGDWSTPCFGDSGGPLFGQVNGVDHIFGIVSYGAMPSCATAGQIGVYTRIAAFHAFIGYTMNRTRELGYSNLCPARLTPVISYAARGDGRTDVTVKWSDDTRAEGYRLFYTPYQRMGNGPQKFELGQHQTELSVVLQSGQKFFIAVQGSSARCDGPLSPLQVVKVP